MRPALPFRAALLALALLAVPALARDVPPPGVPTSGVIGVEEAYLSPDFWIARLHEADAPVLDRGAIEAQNARLLRMDPSLHDLPSLAAA